MTIVYIAILLVTESKYFVTCFLVDGYFICSCVSRWIQARSSSPELSAVAQKAIVRLQIACDSFFCGWQKIKL